MIDSLTGGVHFRTSLVRRTNVFYSVKDGNWNDPFTWESNAKRKKNFPTATDHVVINHDVILDGQNQCKSLTVNKKLTWQSTTNKHLIVWEDLFVPGTLDMTANSSGLYLYGINNMIANLTHNGTTSSTISYVRPTTQRFATGIVYGQVIFVGGPYGSGTIPASSYTLEGNFEAYNFTMQSTQSVMGVNWSGGTTSFDIRGFNFTINNNFKIAHSGQFKKSINTGTFLIKGDITVGTGQCDWDFPANYEIEVRGGVGNQSQASGWNTINALTVRYTTNNQTIALGSNNWRSTTQNEFNHLIDGVEVTLTNQNISNLTMCLETKGWINGTTPTSKLISKATIVYLNAQTPMQTGLMDCSSFQNHFNYAAAFNQNIKGVNYWHLLVSGTSSATKYLTADTVLTGNFSASGLGILEIGAFAFNVGGTTSVQGGFNNNTASIKKSSSTGNVVFTGAVTFNTGNKVLFSGSPSVEFKAGGQFSGWGQAADLGSGTITITNNQTWLNNEGTFNLNGTVVINGAITWITTGNSSYNFYGTVNGNNAASTLRNGGTITMFNASQPIPMSTLGIYDRTTLANTIGWSFNGDYTLPWTNLSGLIIGGTGVKTLGGDTTLTGNFTLRGIGELQLDAYAFTVDGTTTIEYDASTLGGAFKKNSATGLILLKGAVNLNSGRFDLSAGNPNIEFRNGGTLSKGQIAETNYGLGEIRFTTNAQTITNNTATITLPNIVIAPGIVVTAETGLTINNTVSLNGQDSASKLINKANLLYKGTTEPMATGILDTNSFANTFDYARTGDQPVKGNAYRVLAISGSGNKTLQGNVTTQASNGYTVGGTAALVLNGFTKTP